MTGPLHGIRVLDLTWALAGPYATMILADLGAEVIKIEIPEQGDFARQNPPFIGDLSAYFLSLNRGKQGIVLNLKSPAGRSVFLDLVAKSDVVVENLRPGTMERLGLGYDALRERNPAIIYAACSGFGRSHPDGSKGAYDIIIQAIAGTMSITGQPDGPPTRVGFSIGDIAGGMYCGLAILAALLERTRSGQGQEVEVTLYAAQLAMLENAFARYFATNEVPERLGTWHPAVAAFGAFATADSYITIAAATQAQWEALCRALGRADLLADARFATNASRNAHREALHSLLAQCLASASTDEWVQRLEAAGVPCGPVKDIAQAAASSEFEFSGMLANINHPRLGSLKILGSPMRFSRTPVKVDQPAPDLGEHTGAVLSRLLGADEAQLQAWREAGAI